MSKKEILLSILKIRNQFTYGSIIRIEEKPNYDWLMKELLKLEKMIEKVK
jgi:hypothetical protein